MRHLYATLLLAAPFLAWGQDHPGDLIIHRAAPFHAAAVAHDDSLRAEEGKLPLYGRTLPLGLNSSQGEWSVEGNERVCRLAISSPGALAMELFMDQVTVPAGARMRITDLDGNALSPSFPVLLSADAQEFSTPLVPGDTWVLEYREPVDAEFPGSFEITQLGHAYRDVGISNDREGSCHVNVACSPEADGWAGPIRATVRISVVVPQGTGWCSGTLVNNVREDCTPYILTAFHCGWESTTANFNQYKFYFNFQYSGCSGGSYSTSQYITGSQLKAYSDDYNPLYQGLGGSDFMLLRTNVAIPNSFDPYWAGWDATNLLTVTADGVCIHHPTGAPKRISTYTQTLTTGHPMASSGLMSHYKVIWAPTEHGWGITEDGSSGAGLFKQIDGTGPVLIGTCTGNSSGMNCNNHSGYAYFGKMSYHWTNNPNAANLKLKAWLDPDNTGTLILAGSDDPCAAQAGVAEGRGDTEVRTFPNPTSHLVTISRPDPTGTRYTIMDAAGHTVLAGSLAGTEATIDVGHLSDGAYLLRLENHAQVPRTARLIILH